MGTLNQGEKSNIEKHAYLIMAHGNIELLKRLIHALDDERNDIYVHIDLKFTDYDARQLEGLTVKSGLYQVNRGKVYWGHYSMVDCEMKLLRTAVDNGPYRYYHLLSGQDFPIRSQQYIHEFFDRSDLEYITCWENQTGAGDATDYSDRYKYYYLFMKYYRFRYIPWTLSSKVVVGLDNLILKIQKTFKVDRSAGREVSVYKGDQWFSITDAFARYILLNEPKYRKIIKYTFAPDEFIIATIACDSDFKARIAGLNGRLIDWKRGTPYVFREDDFDEIVNSDRLFVRKVSLDDEDLLVTKLEQYITEH